MRFVCIKYLLGVLLQRACLMLEMVFWRVQTSWMIQKLKNPAGDVRRDLHINHKIKRKWDMPNALIYWFVTSIHVIKRFDHRGYVYVVRSKVINKFVRQHPSLYYILVHPTTLNDVLKTYLETNCKWTTALPTDQKIFVHEKQERIALLIEEKLQMILSIERVYSFEKFQF